MPPLEAWEKVLIYMGALNNVEGEGEGHTAHGDMCCTDCHGGVNSDDMNTAHQGVVRDPSDWEASGDPSDSVCVECHPGIVDTHADSLHHTLDGYYQKLETRWNPARTEVIDTVMDNHCANCHSSCGQCHVSQPTSAGGGLLERHAFLEVPPMTRTCTGCHGSRVKSEYTGRNEGYPADVHLRTGRMTCVDCHTEAEMHGHGVVGEHRLEGAQDPRCEDCHEDVVTGASENEFHSAHSGSLSCQTCHSVPYKNCYNCHVQQSDDGTPYFKIDESQMDFAIGRNARANWERPYEYVPVRHVPISRESFEFYGEDLLKNFDALPTWTYATPHNIQLHTPQTESCDSCHGNPDLFLTADKVAENELDANLSVIVDEESIPRPLEEIRAEQEKQQEENEEPEETTEEGESSTN